MAKNDAKSNYVHYVPAAKKVPNWYEKYKFVLVTSMEQLNQVFIDSNWTPGKSFISFDTETTGLDPEELDIVGYSFCIDGMSTYYVPVNHFQYVHNLGEDSCEYIYKRMCEARKVFMYNSRFDCRVMEYIGYKARKDDLDKRRWTYVKYDMSKVPIMDVMNAVWNADTNIKLPSLKWSSLHFLGYEQMHFDEVIEEAGNFYYLNPEETPDTVFYAGADALCTYLLVPAVMKYYKESGVAGQLDDAVMYPLMHYETEKLFLDYDKICSMQKECLEGLAEAEKTVYDTLGYQINLNSPVQVAQALERLGIDTGERTDSGKMAVGVKTLESLSSEIQEKFPALKAYVKYKELGKLNSSYFTAYRKEAERRGYLRGSYKLHMVPTGRLSCGTDKKNPFFSPCNLQAIPKPHVSMYDVYDLGDRDLSSKKDNIILGYHFVISEYDENKKHIVPDDPRYIGQAEGMNPKLNVRSCITPKWSPDDGDEEFLYCACDYAAQELRIVANISKEPVWADAFIHGRDVHKSCYSTDTEFLTEDGFKTYEYISENTKIAQYNPDTGKIDFVNAGKLYTNEVDTLYHFVGNNTDLLVTENHRMYYKSALNYKIKEASKLIKNYGYTFMTGADIDDSYVCKPPKEVRIPKSYHRDEIVIDMMDFCEMLGYILTDGGTCFKSGGQKVVYMSQSEAKMHVLKKIQALNERLGLLFKEGVEYCKGKEYVIRDGDRLVRGVASDNFHRFSVASANLYKYICDEFGGPLKKDRKLPLWFKNLPKEYISKFVEAVLDGDGSYGPDETDNSAGIPFQSKKMVDDFQYLLMRLGHRSNWREEVSGNGVKMYRMNIVFNRNETKVSSKYAEVIKVPEKTLAVCYSVPSGLLVVRRNGKMSICGNTAIALWGEENYNKDFRKRAKGANFGIVYGASAASFNDPAYGIYSLSEAEEFYNNFKSKLPTLFQWMDRKQRQGRKNGTIYTYFGRPRRVKGYFDNHNAGFANRTIINTQIQGTAGDMLKLVMCRLWKNLLDNPNYRDDVRFMVTIHDEIGYSVRVKRLEEILSLIEQNQTVILKEWAIPIITEASIGWSVGGLFAFEKVEDQSRPFGFSYRPKLE